MIGRFGVKLESLPAAASDLPEDDLSEWQRKLMVWTGLSVLFVQWILCCLIPAFFPLSKYGLLISNVGQGLVFASFSFGGTLSSPYIAPIMLRLGKKRTVMWGICGMAVFNTAFGLVPLVFEALYGGDHAEDLAVHSTAMTIAFAVMGFLYGATSCLAEGGIYAILAAAFPNELGSVIAKCEAAVAVGAMVGPFVGGAVFDAAAPLGPMWRFVLPFLVVLPLPVLNGAAFQSLFPEVPSVDEEQQQQPVSQYTSFQTALVLFMVTANSTVFSALEPVLAIRCSYGHVQLSSTAVGALFLLCSLTYLGVTLPLGKFVDGVNSIPVLNSIQGAGMALYVLAFVMLGPFYMDGDISLDASGLFDNKLSMWMAQAVIGGACALTVIPSLPALLAGVPEEQEFARAKITGWWMAAYGIGYTAGPMLGSSMMGLSSSTFCNPRVCAAETALEQQCHCIDGFGSVMALLSAAMAATMLVSALQGTVYRKSGGGGGGGQGSGCTQDGI
jgi:MFS family permease